MDYLLQAPASGRVQKEGAPLHCRPSLFQRPSEACGIGSRQAPAKAPKLLDRLREALRTRHYSRRTEQTYCLWVKRFIYFHNIRNPAEMAEPEINAFLTHLAVKEKVSAST